MPFKRTPMRYAHTNGHTSCTYTENGETIITCGSDGDIRTWQGIDDDDPSSKCLGEFVLAVAHYDKRMLVSTDLNLVQAYTFPEGDRDGTELRFTAPVTCIKVNDKFIAAGSEDTDIKYLPRDKSERDAILSGHKGPILCVDLSKKDLLASSSGDGTIKIWDLKEKKEVKTISGLPKVNTFDSVKSFVSPCFDPPTGRMLAYAKDKEIIILNTNTWEVRTILADDNVTSSYTCCSFSWCGQYLAAGTEAGEISVWNVPKSETVRGQSTSPESKSVTAIVWNPKNNGEFAYCDATGQLGTVVGCDDDDANGDADGNDFLASEAIEEDAESDLDGLQFDDDDDNEDGDNENCFNLGKIKNDTLRENGLIPDDDSIDSALKSDRSSPDRRVHVKTYSQQAPFQPGSTPADLEHRYLLWNNVGIVRGNNSDAGGSIDVEFHDASVHYALHLDNYESHTLAGLSTTVLALSGGTSSKLVCIILGSSSREWSVDFPDCISAVALTATTSLVAVATENRYLRVFTAMGTQRQVFCIPGPVVALAGHGEKLFVAYHRAPATEDQHITAMFIQFFGLNVRCKEVNIPLPKGKKLSWIGFSDRGSPVIYDTTGMVTMFNMKSQCWIPVCDTTLPDRIVSNNYFIIDVLESMQTVQAVLCRGTSYPMTNPRPLLNELPMHIPMCDEESEKSKFEETLIRYSSFNVENADNIIKETATKLFAHACRNEVEARAKELVEMIASPQILSLAVKYASKLRRIHLVEKLTELLPHIEEQEKTREKEMQENEVELMNVIQNSPVNAGLLMMQRNKTAPEQKINISPKPMLISNQRRNPFKRNSAVGCSTPGVASSPSNPLSHLTEKAIGFEPRKSLQKPTTTYNDATTGSSSTPSADSEFDDGAGPSGIQNHRKPMEPSGSEASPMDLGESQESEIIPSSIVDNNNYSNNNNNNDVRNKKSSTTPAKGTFIVWFTANKENLKEKHPDVTAQELTKLAMKEYKAISHNGTSSGTSSNANASKGITCNGSSNSISSVDVENATAAGSSKQLNGKRKLDEANGETQSGISKLARFGFKK